MERRQPNSLVKFTTAESAIKILTEGKLRWSAPCCFHDPFELDHRSALNFDSRALLLAAVKNTIALIFSRDEPRGGSPLIKAIRRWRAEERFESEEEAHEVLSELLQSMVTQREPELLSIMRDWRNYSKSLRVLCMSDGHEDINLWHTYSDNHTGAAIRFGCAEDSSLASPHPVHYTERKPEITPLSEQIEILINQSNIRVQDSFPEKFLTKAKPNSKEKEWRFLREASGNPSHDETSWFEDVPFPLTEVRAVYLGSAIDSKNKEQLLSLVKRKYQKVKIFQAQPLHHKYELDFERINSSGNPLPA